MARFAVSVKMGASANGTPTVGSVGGCPDGFTSANAAQTLVTNDIATLVADGATPTQAHVTTLNTDWTAYKPSLNPTNVDVVLSFDAAVITTRTALRQAVAAMLAAVESGLGGLTP